MSALASSAHGAPSLAHFQRHTTGEAPHHSQKPHLSRSSLQLHAGHTCNTPTSQRHYSPSQCHYSPSQSQFRQISMNTLTSRCSLVHHKNAALMASHHHNSRSVCHYRPSHHHYSQSQSPSRRPRSLVRSQQQPADNTEGQQQRQREDSGVPSPTSGSAQIGEPDAVAVVPGKRDWKALAGWLFLAGFTLGAPLDGLHSVVGLQVYDGPGAIVIGSPVNGLITSLWVFPLLGIMYVVVGGLQLLLDSRFPPSSSVPASHGALTQMLTSLGVLVGLLRLSSLMFESELSPAIIFPVLLVVAHANWYCFDRTLPGYLLALLVATGAPLSEVLFLKLGVWHYTTPDIFVLGEGLVSWTCCCYFFYTQWVATVARALDVALAPPVVPPGEGPKDSIL